MIKFLIGVLISGILGISLMCCIILNDKEGKKWIIFILTFMTSPLINRGRKNLIATIYSRRDTTNYDLVIN